MATGDLIKLGTFYKSGVKQYNPTNPIANGDIPQFVAGQTLEIRDTDATDYYKIRWREVNVNNKKLLIADRNILGSVSWDDLNLQGLVSGKNITIDGQQFRLRLLTGGSNARNGNAWDDFDGGSPVTNEWDQIIGNESNYTELPTPNTQDLAGVTNGTHNQFWNWANMRTWVQEADTSLQNASCRGEASAKYFSQLYSSARGSNVGWRPVLEVLYTPPNIRPMIGGTRRTYDKGWVRVNGVWRGIDEIHVKIGSAWRKSE